MSEKCQEQFSAPPAEPAWRSEPPEPEWPGDWRLEDPRAERDAELDRLRTRSAWEADK